jgi:transposase-like protein
MGMGAGCHGVSALSASQQAYEHMLAAGCTQQEAARRYGIAQSSLSGWIRRHIPADQRRTPKTSRKMRPVSRSKQAWDYHLATGCTLYRAAKHTGINPDTLYEWAKHHKAKED